jgi:hypothetical protein
MSTGLYGNTTAGWCGNCGRRRGADGRCANCDPWWTSPLFQTGGPIILLVSLILIVSLSVFGKRQENASNGGGNRIPATVITPNLPATRIPSYVNRPSAPVNIPPPSSIASYAPPPTAEQIQYRQLQELRTVTAYVDKVVEHDQAAQAQQKRLQSQYPAPARRPAVSGAATQASLQTF